MQYCRTKFCLKQKLENSIAVTFPAFRATLQRHCVELHAVWYHDQAPLLAVSHAAQELGRSPVLKRWSWVALKHSLLWGWQRRTWLVRLLWFLVPLMRQSCSEYQTVSTRTHQQSLKQALFLREDLDFSTFASDSVSFSFFFFFENVK